jgi:CubicO group peptidase (beta-lactamase class C family)
MHRLAIGLLLLGPLPAPVLGQDVPPGLDQVVSRVMQTFEVPGMAVAIVKDGKVLAARGYGVKTLGKPDPVDAQTLFGIASNTKLFTATALGLLVEDGLIEWDTPVVRYVPWFAMWDAWVTQNITVRDLLVHRSGLGLGAGDLLWWPPSTYNRKEIAYRLRYLPPVTSFRSAYAYDNVLYTVAGEVIEAVSGLPWEEFVQTRILDRVGMLGSNVRHSAAEEGGNVATPHARVDGTVRPVKPFGSDNTNPAGGINASAGDIAKWLIVQLDSGRTGSDVRLFSEETARQLWTTVVPRDPGVPPNELAPLRGGFLGYALGINVHGRSARLCLTARHAAGSQDRRRDPHEHGIGRGFQRAGVDHPRLLSRRPAARLDRRVRSTRAARRGGDARGGVGDRRRAPCDVEAIAPARALRRHLPRRLVRRHRPSAGHGTPRDAVRQDALSAWRPGALAVRHLRGPLARSRAACRRVHHVRPRPRRLDP